MSTTTEDLVHAYFKAWNDLDRDHRETTFEALFTQDAEIIDPDWTARGRAAIAAISQAREEKLGNLVLAVTDIISTHHELALFSWNLHHPDTPSEPLATGYGIVNSEDGRIRRAYNFFG